jgi:hypothetical protein
MRWARFSLSALFALTAACATNPAPSPSASAPKAATTKVDAGAEAIFEEFAPPQVERIAAAQPYVEAAANEYDLEPELIYGVIWVESRFQAKAKSPAGARGLMQLMPQTAAALAKQLGVTRPRSYDPAFNVKAGSYYLRRLLDRYEGDEVLALAAYNAGAGNVNKWRKAGKDLPEYSQKYVRAVMEARARFRGTPLDAQREQALAQAQPAPPPVEAVTEPDPPKPEAEPQPPPPQDEVTDYEPVFEPRPDLDVEPQQKLPRKAPPPRNLASSADVGVGVLPDVGG